MTCVWWRARKCAGAEFDPLSRADSRSGDQRRADAQEDARGVRRRRARRPRVLHQGGSARGRFRLNSMWDCDSWLWMQLILQITPSLAVPIPVQPSQFAPLSLVSVLTPVRLPFTFPHKKIVEVIPRSYQSHSSPTNLSPTKPQPRQRSRCFRSRTTSSLSRTSAPSAFLRYLQI